MNKMTLRTLPASLLLAFAGVASASSFQTLEQSASGIATSFAGSAAIADNASTNFYNPAGLTQLKGVQISLGVTGLKSNVQYSVNGGNAGDTLLSPNLYLSVPLTRDLYFGFGVSRPFGLSTEYAAGWAGDAAMRKAELKTVNYNPSIAYRLNDKVSLGLGLNHQKLDLDLNQAGVASSGNDSATGWNAGALFTLSPAMRVGLAYRSGLDYRLNGIGAANGDLKLPGTFTLSVWQQVSDRWEAMGDLSFTQWNRLDASTVAISAANERNTWRLAWGAGYKYNEAAKAKFGVAYERSPTRDGDPSFVTPENGRLWLSIGGQWNAGTAGKFDLGYAYKLSRDVNATQNGLNGKFETSGHVLGLQYSTGF